MDKILTGNRDPDLLILSNLDDRDLFHFCLSNKYAAKLCNNEDFWRNRLIMRHGIKLLKYKHQTRTYKDFYLSLIRYLDKGIDRIGYATYYQDYDLIEYFIDDYLEYLKKKYNDPYNKERFEKFLNKGLYVAAMNGNKELVDYFISKGAQDVDTALYNAVRANTSEMVHYLMSLGSNNPYMGIMGAVDSLEKENQKKWIDFFISRGNLPNLGAAYDKAAQINDLDIIKYLMTKEATVENFNAGLRSAIENKHYDLMNFFLEQGANDWEIGLYAAAYIGDKNLINFFIDKGAHDWIFGLHGAQDARNQELIDYFQAKINNG